MKRSDLRDRRVALLGLGIDIEAALPTILDAHPRELFVLEERHTEVPPDLRETQVFAQLADVPDVEIAVRSPGFPIYRPDVREWLARGVETVTPLGLWITERGTRPSIAITGTKGKSTTSFLTVSALELLGVTACVLGNIGVPPWTVDPVTDDLPVLEISSFQAVDLVHTSPYAALTSIGDDHADWHGSTRQYHHDKARVFLAPALTHTRWCGVLADVELPDPFPAVAFHKLAAPGGGVRHRNALIAAATALATQGEVDERAATDLATKLLDHYPELPGRFHRIAVVNDVEYIDDSLASNPLGVVASLSDLELHAVTLILGGASRGAAFDDVYRVIAMRSHPTVVICIDDARALADVVGATGAIVEFAPDLEAAVRRAHQVTARDGVVLFSPGMPTPDPQGRWHARSERFRIAVEALDIGK